jgi:GDP-D-mannose dehydratase
MELTEILDNVHVRNLITGIEGQDGRILSAMLTQMGEEVFGVARNSIHKPGDFVNHSETIDVSDSHSFIEFLDFVKPIRIFHLAASHANSHEMQDHGEKYEREMMATHVVGTENILNWQKKNSKLESHSVIALSSQMYRPRMRISVIDESEEINPSTRYGESKYLALKCIREYRSNSDIKTSGAILFNHSSIFSKGDFVLQVLARQIASCVANNSRQIFLRDFDASFDISDAFNICDGLSKMARQHVGTEFILSSGIETSLRNLAQRCLSYFNVLDGIELISTLPSNAKAKVMVGSPKKAVELLDWKPTSDPLHLMVKLVKHHLEEKENDKYSNL